MFRSVHLVAASFALLCVCSSSTKAQVATSSHSHVIVVKLVQNGGSKPYGFSPDFVTAQRGDTVRFVEGAGAIHNVHFTLHPKGAKLGSATIGPYLTSIGQKYDVVIDGRFTEGKYEFVCDPHAMLGMRGTLMVAGSSTSSSDGKGGHGKS